MAEKTRREEIVEIDLSKVEAAALLEVLADSGQTLQQFMRSETQRVLALGGRFAGTPKVDYPFPEVSPLLRGLDFLPAA